MSTVAVAERSARGPSALSQPAYHHLRCSCCFISLVAKAQKHFLANAVKLTTSASSVAGRAAAVADTNSRKEQVPAESVREEG